MTMTVSIDWATKKITVPKADLTQPGASTSFFTYDTDNQFWAEVKAAEASEAGIVFDNLVDRNAPYTIGGVTYAPKVEVLPPATVEFEDGDYTVALQGSNNNIFDKENGILVKNNVLPIPGNSAGLQIVQTGISGLTPAESAALLQLSTDYSSLDDRVGFLEVMARAKKKVARSVSKLLLTDSVSGRSFEADLFQDEAETQPYAGEGIEVQGEITETTP